MKKLLTIVAVVFASATVQAAYLVWQVQDQTSFGDWDKAKIYSIDKSTEKPTYTVIGQTVNIGEGNTPLTKVNLENVSGYAEFSYYIELINSSTGALMAYSNTPQTYAQLEEAGSIAATLEDVPSVAPWHGGSYSAPEPTSAMLMLLGVAGLALKRKQKKA